MKRLLEVFDDFRNFLMMQQKKIVNEDTDDHKPKLPSSYTGLTLQYHGNDHVNDSVSK